MARQLADGLEREGYAPLVASDGQEAMELALDWVLPKIDGCKVAMHLRQAGLTC